MPLARPCDDEEALAATLLLAATSLHKAAAPSRVPRWFEGWEATIHKRLAAYLAASRRRAIEAVGSEKPSPLTVVRVEDALIDQQAADALIFSLAEAFGETIKLAMMEGRRVAEAVLAHHAQKAAAGYGTSLDQANTRAMDWGNRYAARLVTNVNATTKKMIREGVVAAVESGASADDLAGVLADDLGFSDSRALTIARTELAFANSLGDLEGYREAGITQKEWQVSDAEVCDVCLDHDGEVLPLDRDFMLDFSTSKSTKIVPVPAPPGHPSCRCVLLPVTKYDLPRAPRPKPPKPKPAPKPPAPPPPAPPPKPPKPTPVAAPVAPPPPNTDEVNAMHASFAESATKILGATIHSKPNVALDDSQWVPPDNAVTTWTGQILMGTQRSNELREALALRLADKPLTPAAADGIKFLVHENIHSLGPYRTPLPSLDPKAPPLSENFLRSAPSVRNTARGRQIDYYVTPIGNLMEEGTTELLAVRHWREFAERAGFRLDPDPTVGPHRLGSTLNGTPNLNTRHTYPDEVSAIEAISSIAVGDVPRAGYLSPKADAFLLRLSLTDPLKRARFLAEALAAKAPPAARAQAVKLLTPWIVGRLPVLASMGPWRGAAAMQKDIADLIASARSAA